MYREDNYSNNLFFTASLIEYIARKTNNTKKDTYCYLGRENVAKIYSLADIYHSEPIEEVGDEFIRNSHIKNGNYNILTNVKYKIPTYFEMGRIYTRLVKRIDNNKDNYLDTLYDVFNSPIMEKLDNYNSSMYYENPEYIYDFYQSLS